MRINGRIYPWNWSKKEKINKSSRNMPLPHTPWSHREFDEFPNARKCFHGEINLRGWGSQSMKKNNPNTKTD